MWFSKKEQLMEKQLASKLHLCGLDAYHNYKEMGQSGEEWSRFRETIAHQLLKECFIFYKKNKERG